MIEYPYLLVLNEVKILNYAITETIFDTTFFANNKKKNSLNS